MNILSNVINEYIMKVLYMWFTKNINECIYESVIKCIYEANYKEYYESVIKEY